MRLAVVSVVCMGVALFAGKGTQLLMPGPLISAHGAIEACSTCHTKSGSGKISWIAGLVAGDPHADSKACLTCHKMPQSAFNAHAASPGVLLQSTKRLKKVAADGIAPLAARVQGAAFPAEKVASRLYCATCHQEHQGTGFDLRNMSNEKCRSCHVVKFDGFDGHHPEFDGYPFKRRTRIIYDHAGHFDKHYPELAKKDPDKRIPAACATCHDSHDDKRVMAVAPFDGTCATCHLDQITGKTRATGPKGIAFVTLPGLDVQTLKSKNAAIGEWPESSEADLTPFMKVMISRSEQGRALIETVDGLNLQDLTRASDLQIKAVTELVWEIKKLVVALISGKASEVLGNLELGDGIKLDAGLVTDLTASIPRDVLIGAQQQWLPNLAIEMTAGRDAVSKRREAEAAATRAVATDNVSPKPGNEPGKPSQKSAAPSDERSIDEEHVGTNADTPSQDEPAMRKLDPPICVASLFGQCLITKGPQAGGQGQSNKGGAEEGLPPPMRVGANDAAPAITSDKPQPKAANQTDDLLYPTEDELRAMKATGGTPDNALSKSDPAGASTETESAAQPVLSLASDVDPESWAEYGGWYRQDYTIFYRPTGHKDKLIYSWLFLAGPQASNGNKSYMAAIFDQLASKDAPGSCTKCHSVDDIEGKGRMVNFAPAKLATKQNRFTRFIHEPHFGILENRGCLTCHKLAKSVGDAAGPATVGPAVANSDGRMPAPTSAGPGDAATKSSASGADKAATEAVSNYLKSYAQGSPMTFAPEFVSVDKKLCQSCHTKGMARQDCLLCHKYHVSDVTTPIMSTKLPD